MQNNFVGDIGDFGKYALLKALLGDELRLGVHWYYNAEEKNSPHGKLTEYADLRVCDPILYDSLQTIAQGDRSVAAIEQRGILPHNTCFYSDPICNPRAAWNDRALTSLSGVDLVFMDPDNGFGPAGPKYVVPAEVSPYLRRGQSVIVYQHQTREKGGLDVTIPKTFKLLQSVGCGGPQWAFVFRRKAVRIYYVVPSPAHLQTLLQRSKAFLNTRWARDNHFELRLF